MTAILVVDDDPEDRLMAAELLQQEPDWSVATVPTAEEALRHIEARPPDVILTDIRMPGMGGLELTEAVLASHPGIPVVAMTAHGSEELAAEALHIGAASYVPKRYLDRDLVMTLRGVLAATASGKDRVRLYAATERLQWELALPSDPAMIEPTISYLQEQLVPIGLCDDSSRMQVGVALAEALSNAVYHGNLGLSSAMRETDDDGYFTLALRRRGELPWRDRRVRLTVTLTPEEAVYIVGDEGEGFDTRAIPDPTDPTNLERSSGRGLFLIHTFMDEVRFNPAGNEITLIRRRRGT